MLFAVPAASARHLSRSPAGPQTLWAVDVTPWQAANLTSATIASWRAKGINSIVLETKLVGKAAATRVAALAIRGKLTVIALDGKHGACHVALTGSACAMTATSARQALSLARTHGRDSVIAVHLSGPNSVRFLRTLTNTGRPRARDPTAEHASIVHRHRVGDGDRDRSDHADPRSRRSRSNEHSLIPAHQVSRAPVLDEQRSGGYHRRYGSPARADPHGSSYQPASARTRTLTWFIGEQRKRLPDRTLRESVLCGEIREPEVQSRLCRRGLRGRRGSRRHVERPTWRERHFDRGCHNDSQRREHLGVDVG